MSVFPQRGYLQPQANLGASGYFGMANINAGWTLLHGWVSWSYFGSATIFGPASQGLWLGLVGWIVRPAGVAPPGLVLDQNEDWLYWSPFGSADQHFPIWYDGGSPAATKTIPMAGDRDKAFKTARRVTQDSTLYFVYHLFFTAGATDHMRASWSTWMED